jgi:hypothetical protein
MLKESLLHVERDAGVVHAALAFQEVEPIRGGQL